MRPPDHSLARGVTMILCAALVISAQDVVIKLMSGQMTLWQIFALRGLIVLPVLCLYAFLRGSLPAVLRGALRPWPMLRALFITTTFLCFYAALPFLSLATVGAANYSAPVFLTLLSALVLGLPVGRRGWCAVLLGLAGVVLLLRPGADAFSPWALLPLTGAVFYALTHLVTASHSRHNPLLQLALAQNLVMMLAGLAISAALLLSPAPEATRSAYPYIFGDWATLSATLWSVLALLAVLAIAAAVLLAGAYQSAPPVIIGTLEYSYLVFVVIWDVVIFALHPTPLSLLGMGMIVAAGVLVMRRRTSP